MPRGRATAAKFDVSPSCVIKLVERWRQQGTFEPAPGGGGRRAKLAEHAERVHELLAATPDLTIAELKSHLAAAGIGTSRSAIRRFLKGLRPDAKKSPRTPPNRTGRTSPLRGAPGRRSKPALEPKRLVFIDETWATTAMTRRHGRAPRGLKPTPRSSLSLGRAR